MALPALQELKQQRGLSHSWLCHQREKTAPRFNPIQQGRQGFAVPRAKIKVARVRCYSKRVLPQLVEIDKCGRCRHLCYCAGLMPEERISCITFALQSTQFAACRRLGRANNIALRIRPRRRANRLNACGSTEWPDAMCFANPPAVNVDRNRTPQQAN